MMERLNNLDLQKLQETRQKLETGELPSDKVFSVTGEWLLEGPAQFRAVLEFPQGSMLLQTDQPPPSGGGGNFPNPVQYCVFAMAACYATTYATLAAEKGIALQKLRITAETVTNMRAVFGLEEGPIVRSVRLHLEVAAEAPPEELDSLRRLADEKCPAAFTVQNEIPFSSELRVLDRV